MKKIIKPGILLFLAVLIFGLVAFTLSNNQPKTQASTPDAIVPMDEQSTAVYNDAQINTETITPVPDEYGFTYDDVKRRLDSYGIRDARADSGDGTFFESSQVGIGCSRPNGENSASAQLGRNDGRTEVATYSSAQSRDVVAVRQNTANAVARAVSSADYRVGVGHSAVISRVGVGTKIGGKLFSYAFVKFTNSAIGKKIAAGGAAGMLTTALLGFCGVSGLTFSQESVTAMDEAYTANVSRVTANIATECDPLEVAYVLGNRIVYDCGNGTIATANIAEEATADMQCIVEHGVSPIEGTATTWEQFWLQLAADGCADANLPSNLTGFIDWLAKQAGCEPEALDGAGITYDPNITIGGWNVPFSKAPFYDTPPDGFLSSDWIASVDTDGLKFTFWSKSDCKIYQRATSWGVKTDDLSDIYFSYYQKSDGHTSSGSQGRYYVNDLVPPAGQDGALTACFNMNRNFSVVGYDATYSAGSWAGTQITSSAGSAHPLDNIQLVGNGATFDGNGNMINPGTLDYNNVIDNGYQAPNNYQEALSSIDATAVQNDGTTPINQANPVYNPSTTSPATVGSSVTASPGTLTPAPAPSSEDSQYFDIGDLTKVFPFCIPWDLLYLINMLAATPVAPSFTWTMDFSAVNAGSSSVAIDLSPWNSVAAILRKAEDVLFMVGLVMLTRNLIRG